MLATEATALVHGRAAAQEAAETARRTFEEGALAETLPTVEIPAGALEPFDGAVIEVHISDIEDREEWRKHSVLEGLTTERVIGQGVDGYRRALELLAAERET